MTDIALVTLVRLLEDDDYLVEVERMVRHLGVATPDLELDPQRLGAISAMRQVPDHSFRFARAWFAERVAAALDSETTPESGSGAWTFLAYLVAALAVRAGQLHEARRWLQVGHVEAEADELGGEELALFIAAIRHARG